MASANLPETAESAAVEDSGTGNRQPVFWKEVYGFIVISLLAVAVAFAVFPPSAGRLTSMRQLEAHLAQRVEKLAKREKVLEAAIKSVESDPFYREAVYRHVLRLRKSEEEFLQLPRGDICRGSGSRRRNRRQLRDLSGDGRPVRRPLSGALSIRSPDRARHPRLQFPVQRGPASRNQPTPHSRGREAMKSATRLRFAFSSRHGSSPICA